jgi:hypothetical protein
MGEDMILKLVKYAIVIIIVLAVSLLGYLKVLDAQMVTALYSAVLGYLFGVAHNATLPGGIARAQQPPQPSGTLQPPAQPGTQPTFPRPQ